MSSLIRIAVVWNSLPNKIGVHFAGNGEFDMIGSKNHTAYPYLVSSAALVFCETSASISKKIKMGMKIRAALRMLLDILRQHRTITALRALSTFACKFSVILHKISLKGDSLTASILYNLRKIC